LKSNRHAGLRNVPDWEAFPADGPLLVTDCAGRASNALLHPFGIATVLSLSGITANVYAATYKVDTAKSELVVQLFREGIASALAHDHVVRATQYTGTVNFDPAAATGASIQLEVRALGLEADEPAMRAKYETRGELSEKDRQKINATMHSEKQLNTSKFQTISFKSTNIQEQANGKYMVTGNLTIRGKTNRVSFPATAELKDGVFYGKGQIKFKQSSFGYEPYSAFLGAIRNQDGVVLNVNIVADP
jgi:polyisoprenoid-binding protein YceI